MASVIARAKLARAAFCLNARARSPRWVRALPALILMTDERRMPDPARAARGLPAGAAIILRHTDPKLRAELAWKLRAIARARRLVLLIAGDAALARHVGADGLHLPEARVAEAAHWRAVNPSFLITGAAHSLRALLAAKRAGVDAALLAPAFPTLSHPGRAALGAQRLLLMAGQSPVPVYALGGISQKTVLRLAGGRLAGLAAIEALLPDQSA